MAAAVLPSPKRRELILPLKANLAHCRTGVKGTKLLHHKFGARLERNNPAGAWRRRHRMIDRFVTGTGREAKFLAEARTLARFFWKGFDSMLAS